MPENTIKPPNNPAPVSAKQVAGMRKRQQIASSNKTMFLWVAGASVLVAFALVISIFLLKQIIFNEKVLIEKNKTISTLDKNLDSAGDLNSNVSKLRADKNLTLARSTSSDNNLDVVIDALPYDADAEALGSSLQTYLLTGASIESLSVESPDPESEGTGGIDTSSIETVGDTQTLSFSFKATGTSQQLSDLLNNLNRSIRPMYVVSIQVESAGASNLTATVQATTFYQPKKTVELNEKVIKP